MNTQSPSKAKAMLAAAVALAALIGGCAAPAATDPPTAGPDATATTPAATMSPEPGQGEGPATETDPEPTPAADPGITITSSGSDFGPMLFDASQQAIYIWEVETTSEARCYGDCADAWPPVLTDGAPVAAGDVSAAMLGTTTRSDGTTQVTYNGHPLYYYAHEAPGEVRCHNVATHGGLWWVIQPDGDRAP